MQEDDEIVPETAQTPARVLGKAGRPPKIPGAPRQRSTHFRTTVAWDDWVKELAGICSRDVPGLIDDALVFYAAHKKFPKTPPRR